jgi:hypothetical protein
MGRVDPLCGSSLPEQLWRHARAAQFMTDRRPVRLGLVPDARLESSLGANSRPVADGTIATNIQGVSFWD